MNRTILTRMPAGIPGEITRREDCTIEPNILGADMAFGTCGKIVGGKFVPIEAGDEAADVYGILVRPYPSQGGATGLATGGKLPSGAPCDVLRRGYISAALARGTAAKAGAVHLRVAVAVGKAVGELEAAAVADETVALPATFMGEADASGNVELAYNI